MNTAPAQSLPTRHPSREARRRVQSVAGDPWFYADWSEAIFLHFEVNAEALQAVVPFPLDLWNGRAYVTLVGFTMKNMSPRLFGGRGTRLVSALAAHEFLNVRTYVKRDGEPGIHFLAEFIPQLLARPLGPLLFGLPYRMGRLAFAHQPGRDRVEGCVTARHGALRYSIPLPNGPTFLPCVAGGFDEFLLERYTCFTHTAGVSRRFRIWHEPWPQIPVEAAVQDASLLTGLGPWAAKARFVAANYSPGVTGVWMGGPRFIRRTAAAG